ncbi:MAG: hypothetical protein BIFFINMI_03637 [Phycisphaerae bacterium]|nr:hypothetical protein [Phycisphaerae bacterium]
MDKSQEVAAAQLASAVTEQAAAALADAARLIRHCLDQLADEQVWSRIAEDRNSIGNLILHLCGNVRQWLVAGMGGAKFDRDRPKEFSERGPISRADLLARLDAAVRDATTTLKAAGAADLLRARNVQGSEVSGIKAIFSSVPHFRGHAQEIVQMTRTLVGPAYRFSYTPKPAKPGASA